MHIKRLFLFIAVFVAMNIINPVIAIKDPEIFPSIAYVSRDSIAVVILEGIEIRLIAPGFGTYSPVWSPALAEPIVMTDV